MCRKVLGTFFLNDVLCTYLVFKIRKSNENHYCSKKVDILYALLHSKTYIFTYIRVAQFANGHFVSHGAQTIT